MRTDVPSISSSRYSSSCTSSSRSFIPAASSTSTPKSKKPDLSTVLVPDGKPLSDEESDGRRMYYASRGHLANKYPSCREQAQGMAAYPVPVSKEEETASEAVCSDPPN